MAFDKTGTLTLGKPKLVDLRATEGISEEELLRLAASAERLSEHPLADAVVDAAAERGLPLEEAAELEAIVGRGIRARVGQQSVWVGKAELATDRGVVPPQLAESAEQLAAEG